MTSPRDAVMQILRESAPLEWVDRLADDTRIVEDLGFDSLDQIELALAIDMATGVNLDTDSNVIAQPLMGTVGELIAAVEAAKA